MDGTDLPVGFELVIKEDISDNIYEKVPFPTFPLNNKDVDIQNMTYDDLVHNNYDNLLSVLKANTQFELAICVCMYSEDKKMLRYTLQGVS